MLAKYQDDQRLTPISFIKKNNNKFQVFGALKLHTKHDFMNQLINKTQLIQNLVYVLYREHVNQR